MIYLDFEKPIEELADKLTKAKELADIDNLDTTKIISDIEEKILKTKKNIYNNLSPWQKVQVSRHPQRPYSLDYINAITDGDFIELHGDRGVKDDKAMIGGWGTIGKQTVMFIGQQKGRLCQSITVYGFFMTMTFLFIGIVVIHLMFIMMIKKLIVSRSWKQ